MEGNFQIDQVRKELGANGGEEDEIRIIVKLVDNDVQGKAKMTTSQSKSNEIIIAGLVLSIIGAFITVGTYTGLIDMGNSYLIVYDPFFGGISLLLTGLAQGRKS